MLFAGRIIARDPNGLGGADTSGWCRCDNSCEYALKDKSSHILTPHNEWFCTSLASDAGIPCPPHVVLEDPPDSGTYVFGSQWEGGVIRDWFNQTAAKIIDFKDLSAMLSRIFAFDHFIYNEDRHVDNYIVRKSLRSHTMLSIDYSRAWMNNDFPLPSLPFQQPQSTLTTYKVILKEFGDFLDQGAINDCLDRLLAVSVSRVEDIISSHPVDWLTSEEKDRIVTWWASDKRPERIEEIRRGLGNGWYV